MSLNGTELGEVIIENPTGGGPRVRNLRLTERCGGAVLRSDEVQAQRPERTGIKTSEQADPLLRPANSAGFVPALMWSRVD